MFTLNLDEKEVFRYLGYGNNKVDLETLNSVLEITELLKSTKSFKTIYKVFDITHIEEGVFLEGTTLTLTGNDIKKLLSQSKKCVLMAVTLGQELENLSRTMSIKDISLSVILDACASSMVEDLCNQLENSIDIEDMFFTDRFSPGYGDLPLDIQKPIINILNAPKTIGLNVTSSGIMIPRKSITAVLGIADTPQEMRIKGCKYCSLVKTCTYRKSGTTCHG
ncbi:MAG: methionine synthase [Clostridia bacterium]